MSIVGEDVTTREYWDGDLGEYETAEESMLTINVKLVTTTTISKRTAYDLLVVFGDIGGLNDFIFLLLTPLIAYIIGDRFSYIILRSLYMQNKGEDKDDESF